MPEPASTAGGVVSMSRQPGERWSRFAGRIANAFGLVLLLVLATYVAASLTTDRGWSGVLIAVLASASATVALTTAEAIPWLVRLAIVLSIVAVALAFVADVTGTPSLLGVSSLIQTLLLLVAGLAVLRAVVTERQVGFRTILGAVSVYVILALLFTFWYVAIDRLQSGPFFAGDPKLGTGDYVFFSLTTLTTTGYGNLVPAAQPGKVVAGIEMLIGQIFLVTLIARLVSLWQPGAWGRLREREQRRGKA